MAMQTMIKASPVTSGADGKRIFDFQIAGTSYRLKTHHDEKIVQELIQFLNERIETVLKQTRTSSFQNAAVLTALNLAEELLELRQMAEKQLHLIESEIDEIAFELDRVENLNQFPQRPEEALAPAES
jgi:cell division protein ZapA